MKIGIDVSQLAFSNTGVSNYLENLVSKLIETDNNNEYILFFSSLRQNIDKIIEKDLTNPRVKVKKFRIPPSVLDILWNRLHIMPIENFIGDVDLFISSDWTQPPTKKAISATIIYDLIVYKFPSETAKKIIFTQKRKLKWVKKECDLIFCISESTKKDIIDIMHIPEKKLKVIYPGV